MNPKSDLNQQKQQPTENQTKPLVTLKLQKPSKFPYQPIYLRLQSYRI